MKPPADPCRALRRGALAPLRAAGLPLLVLLSACTAGRPTHPGEAPALPPAPAAFAQAASQADAEPPLPGPQGWAVFGDPALDDLQRRAAAGNTGLAQAAARVAQAQAALQAATGAGALRVDLQLASSRQGGPLVNAAGTSGPLHNAEIGATLALDAGGRLSRTQQAARADLRQREAQQRHAQLALQAEVARLWFTLQGLAREHTLLETAIRAQQDTVRLLESRERAGLAGAHEAAPARAEAAELATQALGLQQQQTALQLALGALLGTPGATAWAPPAAADPPLPEIPAGIPSQVLARRPDLAAAEQAVEAARQRLGAARATAWPALQLTAAGGAASPELGELLRSAARSWSLAALLTLPLADGGRREAQEAAAAADLALAAAQWREQMLQALREVEEPLAALQALAAQARLLEGARLQAQRSAALARSRLGHGLASQLEVLEAERSALRLARGAQQVQLARRLATVALVRALGGGWGDDAATRTPPPTPDRHAAAH